jgi:hypothetical protein
VLVELRLLELSAVDDLLDSRTAIPPIHAEAASTCRTLAGGADGGRPDCGSGGAAHDGEDDDRESGERAKTPDGVEAGAAAVANVRTAPRPAADTM